MGKAHGFRWGMQSCKGQRDPRAVPVPVQSSSLTQTGLGELLRYAEKHESPRQAVSRVQEGLINNNLVNISPFRNTEIFPVREEVGLKILKRKKHFLCLCQPGTGLGKAVPRRGYSQELHRNSVPWPPHPRRGRAAEP